MVIALQLSGGSIAGCCCAVSNCSVFILQFLYYNNNKLTCSGDGSTAVVALWGAANKTEKWQCLTTIVE